MLKEGVKLPPGHSFRCHFVTARSNGKRFGDFSNIWQGYQIVGSEQVCHAPVSEYGGSKPEVINKNSEKLERMVYLLFYTS